MLTNTAGLVADWQDIAFFVAIGFAAQIVDGALGMAYKVTTSAMLLSIGVAPATVSASVHAAGTFTSIASGLAHWRLGNVDRSLVLRLVVPGMIGGVIGAYVLAKASAELVRPFVSAYLLVLGVFILCKACWGTVKVQGDSRAVGPVGLVGGLLDAIGGGGWGPIVTTTLVGQGVDPRKTIGSVNAAEFFVTLVIAGTLFTVIGISLWPVVASLVVGGIIAAPLAAMATKHLPERLLMAMVGIVVMALCLRTLFKTLL